MEEPDQFELLLQRVSAIVATQSILTAEVLKLRNLPRTDSAVKQHPAIQTNLEVSVNDNSTQQFATTTSEVNIISADTDLESSSIISEMEDQSQCYSNVSAVATQRAQDPYNSDDDDKANSIQFTELAYRRILQRSPLLQG